MKDLDEYKDKYVVYLITFPNNKKYCGYSGNLKRRWRSPEEYSSQPAVYRAINKYGWENLKKEVLYIFNNAKEALEKEAQVIEEMDLLNKDKGYNLVPGGGGPPHGLQFVTEEGYKKMQENGKRLAKEVWDNPEKAAYTIQRMREETHKKRMQLSKKELKEKYGKHNIGNLPPNSKTILQIDLETGDIINEYPSSRRAAISLNLDSAASANIRRVANGKGKKAYGYSWRWKDENIEH